MSAVIQASDVVAAGGVPVKVECATCELPFVALPDPGEAAYLAGIHNDLHHGGTDHAVLVIEHDSAADVDDEADEWV